MPSEIYLNDDEEAALDAVWERLDRRRGVLRESEDAQHHEHGRDGKFTAKGQGGSAAVTTATAQKSGKLAHVGKTIAALAAKTGDKAMSVEHAIAQGAGWLVGKAPKPVQHLLHGAWNLAFAAFKAGTAAAKSVAHEVGGAEHAERVGRILGNIDMAAAVLGKVALVTGLGKVGKIACAVPVASLGYLAYAHVRHPGAVATAAVKAIGSVVGKLRGKKVVEAMAQDDVRRLMEAFRRHSDCADWFEALLSLALPHAGGDVGRALEIAEAALAEHPQMPATDDDDLTGLGLEQLTESDELQESLSVDEDEGSPEERADLIAQILIGVYGDAAMDLLGRVEDGEQKADHEEVLAEAWDAVKHPRDQRGRFITRNSPEALGSAKDKIRAAFKQPHTPQGLQELTEHLSILTVKQLHELKTHYGLKASGRTHTLLAAKIVAKLRGTVDAAQKIHGEPAEKKPPSRKKSVDAHDKPKATPKPATTSPNASQHRQQVLAALDASRDRFNLTSLADVKRRLPDMTREQFHVTVNDLRREGIISLSAAEGRHGISQEEQDAGIPEEDSLLLHATVRDEEAMQRELKPVAAKPTEHVAAITALRDKANAIAADPASHRDGFPSQEHYDETEQVLDALLKSMTKEQAIAAARQISKRKPTSKSDAADAIRHHVFAARRAQAEIAY